MSKEYTYVSEDDDKYMISHPKDGKFPVAKKGISKALHKKIAGLPKAMADGGEITEEDTAPDIGEKHWYNSIVPDFISGSAKSGADMAAKKLDPYTQPVEPAKIPESGVKNAAWQPVEGYNAEKQTVPGYQDQKTPQPQQAIPIPQSGVTTDINQIIGGVQKQRDAESAQQDQLYRAAQENQLVNQAQYENHMNHVNEINNSMDGIEKDIANQKIDPRRLWHNASTGSKVAAGIGMILGGIGAGMTGGRNSAVDIVQKAIEQDIDAQKADLGKKESLLSHNFRKLGNLDAAYNLTKMQQTSVYTSELQKIAATTNNQVIKAKAEQQIGALKLQRDQMSQQLGQQMTVRGIKTGQVPVTNQQVGMIPDKELQETAVAVPGTNIAQFARTKEDAVKAKDATQAYQEYMGAIKEAKDFQSEVGRTGPFTDASKQADRIQHRLQVARLKLEGVDRQIPEKEREAIIADTPNLGSIFRQGNVESSIGDLENIANQKLGSYYKTYLPSYQAPSRNSKETRPVVK